VSRRCWACCALALGATAVLLAQATGPSDEELRREAQNPIANLISVPFQNNTNFPVGKYARVQDVLNIQPVIPFRISEDWNLITRWITPVVFQPDVLSGAGGANGSGDLNPSLFFSPGEPGKIIWGFGPTFLLLTATERTLGQGKWGAGPSFVVLLQPEHWTIGFLTNSICSYAGDKVRPPVNQGLLQYFVNYNMDEGWYMGSQPIITADWRANSANRWTVPFGWAFGRVTGLGKLPINAQLGRYYGLIHPRDEPYGKWQVRMQVAMLFPKAK
jgi:hypothetical protein